MTDKLAWGILGTGAIAKAFAEGLAQSKTGHLIAVASRKRESADAFADKFAVPARHGSYQELLDDKAVQAVYIAIPHPFHAEWAIRAARAKKHVLVEKPIALNAADAMAVIEAATINDVFLMEAFMYRCAPQTQKLVQLIREKKIGALRMIQGAFSFHWPKPFNPASRLTSNELGGGGILDVGCYPVSMSRLLAGAAAGKDFLDPTDVKGAAQLAPTGVDAYAAATLQFSTGVIAQVSCGVQLQQENVLRLYGDDGWILVPTPWVPARNGGSSELRIHLYGQDKPEQITIPSPNQIYAIEADAVARYLPQRQAPSPAMSWDDSLGNMRALDAWRASAGLTYESEKPAGFRSTTIAGEPLSAPAESTMKYGVIQGITKRVSRLVMGCDNQTSFPHAAVMFDDFFSRGGNTFDTANIYAGGKQEQLLGQWITRRNLREQVVIISKGAHTPFCTPRDLLRQFDESLTRLNTDHADIYLMHRDNEDVPAGEFIDVLNDLHRDGKLKAFGGSNWSLDRVTAANEYARRSNKLGFAAVSNNFSLARMVDPVWGGCISASDGPSRAWFVRTQMPLLAWSSQARGFFLPGRAAPDKTDDPELVRCWYAEDNFKRLARVNELAAKRGVLPINIALAYVLNQPFPTFALIGPRTLSETRTSWPALEIELSPTELRWLNIED
jgi:predicted dehydrogenase/aryl-alcohol dehydrogenase-like predicted oxidoreductase